MIFWVWVCWFGCFGLVRDWFGCFDVAYLLYGLLLLAFFDLIYCLVIGVAFAGFGCCGCLCCVGFALDGAC